MKKLSRKISAFILAAAMLILTVMPALADDVASMEYSSLVVGDKTEDLVKVLMIEKGMDIPESEFFYTVSAGTAKSGDATHLDVLAGVDYDKVKINGKINAQNGSIKYGAHDAPEPPVDNAVIDDSTAGTSGNITIKLDPSDSEHYLAVKSTEMDFSDCAFEKPGVYRYIITESGDNPGVVNDQVNTRTVDVYVGNRLAKDGLGTVLPGGYMAYVLEDGSAAYFLKNGEYYLAAANDTMANSSTALTQAQINGLKLQLEVMGYVMYSGTVTTCPASTAGTPGETQTREDLTTVTPNGNEAVSESGEEIEKSVGFKNEYQAYKLELKKEADGNQADLSEYFKFEVKLSGSEAGQEYPVELDNATSTVPKEKIEGATVDYTNPTSLTADADGNATAVFYLQPGHSVVIKDILGGTSYEISEDEEVIDKEGYRTTISAEGDTKYRVKLSAEGAQIKIEDKNTDDKYNTDGLTANTVVTFTNVKEGLIPTGVIMKVLPIVIIGAIVIVALIALVIISKKRRDEDEEEE